MRNIYSGYSYDVAYRIENSSNSSGYSGHSDSVSKHGSWNLKKTICLLITLALQAALIALFFLGNISVYIDESLEAYVIINLIMLGNSLVSGILCLIAHYRIGSKLSTIVNSILGIYIIITAVSSMEGIIITALALLFFCFIEYAVVFGGNLLSELFCKKIY